MTVPCRAVFTHLVRQVLFVLALLCAMAATGAFAGSVEGDDSSLFMEAFGAFQGRDFLLAVEKIGLLEQRFPDSPLRDVALLLLARAHQRAGDNDGAGLAISRFSREFGASPLASSVEPDLASLGKRREAGEILKPDRQLQVAAAKIRDEHRAREQAAAEQRERSRLAALKAAREAIKVAVIPAPAPPVLEAGTRARLPFRLANRGKDAEEFVLTARLPVGWGDAVITTPELQPLQALRLQPGQQTELLLTFTTPADQVDGARLHASVRAASARFNDIGTAHDLPAIVAAPLLRAVSRLQHKTPTVGLQADYRVTLLNVGSRPAGELAMRILLPEQLQVVDSGGDTCRTVGTREVLCDIAGLQQGQMEERTLKVMIAAGTSGKAAQGAVEVRQTAPQTFERFTGAAFTVAAP